MREAAAARGLAFDAVNSNTFQDQPGQALSYKFGSLSHTDPAVRRQAVEHNIECIEIGQRAWLEGVDGVDRRRLELRRPVQSDPRLRPLSRIDARNLCRAAGGLARLHRAQALRAGLLFDGDFRLGHELSGRAGARPKAQCLVDLGHHAPNVNIEQIVARLARFGKLAGFHFNDSKYGDDDLDAGSVEPFRLFLVFNELADAAARKAKDFAPAYMIDQSHNVTDPIESLMQSAIELQRAYAQALIVDRGALAAAQDANDALGAHLELKRAFTTDVSPILAMARLRSGGAIAADRDLSRVELPAREGPRAAGGERVFSGARVAGAAQRGSSAPPSQTPARSSASLRWTISARAPGAK